MERTKTVTVYRDVNSNLLSFWKERERRECTPLWDFKSALTQIPIEESVSVLERTDTSRYDFFKVRFFYYGEANLWVPGHFLRNQGCFRDSHGNSCLGYGYLLDIEVTNLLGLLRYLTERGVRIKAGPIYGVKTYPTKWKVAYRWHFPRSFRVPLEKGNPLHYPEGPYIHIGDDREVVRNWREISCFLPESFLERRTHVLLYPDGCALLTNGIAGNPTFWSRLQSILE